VPNIYPFVQLIPQNKKRPEFERFSLMLATVVSAAGGRYDPSRSVALVRCDPNRGDYDAFRREWIPVPFAAQESVFCLLATGFAVSIVEAWLVFDPETTRYRHE